MRSRRDTRRERLSTNQRKKNNSHRRFGGTIPRKSCFAKTNMPEQPACYRSSFIPSIPAQLAMLLLELTTYIILKIALASLFVNWRTLYVRRLESRRQGHRPCHSRPVASTKTLP